MKESNEILPAQGHFEGHILSLKGQTEKAIDVFEEYLKQDDDEYAMEELIELYKVGFVFERQHGSKGWRRTRGIGGQQQC